jgi:hypothetical protein
MTTTHFNVSASLQGWSEALSKFPVKAQDVYFTPEYHGLHIVNSNGEVFCTLLQDKEQTLIVPGLRLPVPSWLSHKQSATYFDLQTCNGYGGPVASENVTREFLERAWNEWRRESAKNGIVAAFFRLHPLLYNERWLPTDAEIVYDRQTVYVDLRGGGDLAWRGASSRHRNMVNKGRRDGVVIQWNDSEGWIEFERLYANAMERLTAPEALRFSSSYFAKLRGLPGAELACVWRNGEFQAGSVFLFGNRWAHYHLSVRSPESDNTLTNCILQEAIQIAAARGLEGIHLGGGRTSAPEDSLLKFKLGIGEKRLDFKVALVISKPDAFKELCQTWRAENGSSPDWLLGYRQPKKN